MSSQLSQINAPSFTKFCLSSNVNAKITVAERTGEPNIEISIHKPDAVTVEQRIENDTFVIRATRNECGQSDGKKNLLDDLRAAIIKDSVSALVGAFVKNVLQANITANNGPEIIIDLCIPRGFAEVDLDSDNIDIEINHTSIAVIAVKSTNLDFKSSGVLDIEFLRISGTNSDVDLVAGANFKHAKIKGTNANIIIRRHGSFKGIIRSTGSNLDISGNLDGDPISGLISCDVTNGNIVVISLSNLENT